MRRILITWLGLGLITAVVLGRVLRRNDDWELWEQEVKDCSPTMNTTS